MSYKDIIMAVSRETGLPQRLVDKTYRAYWKAIREHITSLPLKDSLTLKELQELRPNVNIPSLGKLTVTGERYTGMKKKHENLKSKQ